MASQEGRDAGNEGPALDPTTSDDFPLIADVAELERFTSEPSSSQMTPEIRGVIAEIALTGLRRYPWKFLLPILHRLLDAALDSFNLIDLEEDQAGPPRPMPDGGTLEQSRTALHSMLDDFSTEAPFTIQRLSEIVLEPRKQYSRIEKFILAVERLLLVTSTVDTTPAEELPPLPKLSSLGDVNENRPSPYDGEPPAGPQPSMEDRLQPMGNGLLDSDEYAIFVGAETGQHGAGELVAIDGHGSGVVAVGSPLLNTAERLPTPMEPAEVIQAEAFVHAALGTSVGVGGEVAEPVAEAIADVALVQPVMQAAAAAENQQPSLQEQQHQQGMEDVVVGQPLVETTAPAEKAVVNNIEQQPKETAAPSVGAPPQDEQQKFDSIEPYTNQQAPIDTIEEPVPAADAHQTT